MMYIFPIFTNIVTREKKYGIVFKMKKCLQIFNFNFESFFFQDQSDTGMTDIYSQISKIKQ